jgi:hypothetical protein
MMLMETSRPRQLAPGRDTDVAEELPKATKVNNAVCKEITTGGNLVSSANGDANAGSNEPCLLAKTLTVSNHLEAQHTNSNKPDVPETLQRQKAIFRPHMITDDSNNTIESKLHTPTHTIDNDTIELEKPENSYQPQSGELLPLAYEPDDTFDASLAKSCPAAGYNHIEHLDRPNARSNSTPRQGSLEAIQKTISTGPTTRLTKNEATAFANSRVDDSRNMSESFDHDPVTETGPRCQIPNTWRRSDGTPIARSPAAKDIVESEQPLRRNIGLEKAETLASEIIIKPSPTLTPVIVVGGVGSSGQDVGKAGDPATHPTTKLANATAIQSSPRAIPGNVTTLKVPGSNLLSGMTPPPPHMSVRTETGTIKEDTSMYGPARETIISRGPWSRESFDLFGAWRPPLGGAADTKS